MRSNASRCARLAAADSVDTTMPLRASVAHARTSFAVDLHHARVAGLDRAELRVVAHLGNAHAAAVEQVDETLARRWLVGLAVDGHVAGKSPVWR